MAVLFLVALLVAACGDATGAGTDDGIEPAPTTSTTVTPEETGDAPPTTSEDGASTSAVADDRQPVVDVAWIADGANPHVLVDARNAAGFDTGHIIGARHLDASVLNTAGPVPYQLGDAEHVAAALGAAGLTADDTIVLYDADGSLYAARVYWALRVYGHADVRILDGGLAAWRAAGGGIATEPTDVVASTIYEIGTPQPSLRLELDEVQAAIGVASFADARSVGEFDGTVDLGTDVSGHIPGAGNVDYLETIDDDGTFLPTEELRALYEGAGVLPEDDIVTYCLVGARAAHAWFVLSELLGYPSVALYDGSWQEYGNTAGVLVES